MRLDHFAGGGWRGTKSASKWMTMMMMTKATFNKILVYLWRGSNTEPALCIAGAVCWNHKKPITLNHGLPLSLFYCYCICFKGRVCQIQLHLMAGEQISNDANLESLRLLERTGRQHPLGHLWTSGFTLYAELNYSHY